MKNISNVKWHPMATTLIGALKACSDSLGRKHSVSWIFGAGGYAFLLNLDRNFCGSHPTLWNMDGMHKNCANLGLALTRVAYWDIPEEAATSLLSAVV